MGSIAADEDALNDAAPSTAEGRDDPGRDPPFDDSGRRMRAADDGLIGAPAAAPALVGSIPSSLRAVGGADGSEFSTPRRILLLSGGATETDGAAAGALFRGRSTCRLAGMMFESGYARNPPDGRASAGAGVSTGADAGVGAMAE